LAAAFEQATGAPFLAKAMAELARRKCPSDWAKLAARLARATRATSWHPSSRRDQPRPRVVARELAAAREQAAAVGY